MPCNGFSAQQWDAGGKAISMEGELVLPLPTSSLISVLLMARAGTCCFQGITRGFACLSACTAFAELTLLLAAADPWNKAQGRTSRHTQRLITACLCCSLASCAYPRLTYFCIFMACFCQELLGMVFVPFQSHGAKSRQPISQQAHAMH